MNFGNKQGWMDNRGSVHEAGLELRFAICLVQLNN